MLIKNSEFSGLTSRESHIFVDKLGLVWAYLTNVQHFAKHCFRTSVVPEPDDVFESIWFALKNMLILWSTWLLHSTIWDYSPVTWILPSCLVMLGQKATSQDPIFEIYCLVSPVPEGFVPLCSRVSQDLISRWNAVLESSCCYFSDMPKCCTGHN